ncbi:unnamed protein product [Linum trigynum]|uniref:adenosylmethionine decarboxylase n=1 Tax=Linum trigynum TaxID=586398 RepID=A0AAV2FCN2_9ROSI
MAVSTSPIGFEGFEKHLEISFSEAQIFKDPNGLLRALTRPQIDLFLDAAKCSIVSSLSNDKLDSYVLFVLTGRVGSLDQSPVVGSKTVSR